MDVAGQILVHWLVGADEGVAHELIPGPQQAEERVEQGLTGGEGEERGVARLGIVSLVLVEIKTFQ